MSEWTLIGKTALIVIHMQNAICKAPSPLEFLGHCRATQEDGIIPHIADLLAAFRGKGLPVICPVSLGIMLNCCQPCPARSQRPSRRRRCICRD